jgi:hypothetical protein
VFWNYLFFIRPIIKDSYPQQVSPATSSLALFQVSDIRQTLGMENAKLSECSAMPPICEAFAEAKFVCGVELHQVRIKGPLMLITEYHSIRRTIHYLPNALNTSSEICY